NQLISGGYINIPIKLYNSVKYEGLSNDAILLYGVLRNNIKFSASSGLRDGEGRLFVIASVSEIMKIIRCSKNTARKILEELKKYYLIKVSEDDDKNRFRNIYLGEIENDEGVEIKSYENKKYGESASKELNKKEKDRDKNIDKGLERESEVIKKTNSDRSKNEPSCIKKSTNNGSKNEPTGIKKVPV
ncbi:MAG: replication initiator protein A, partial [Clostridium sp.]